MKQKRARNPMAGAIIVLSVLVGLLVAVFVLGFTLKNCNVIFPNVTMCGVEIGGKTTAEAQRLVEDKVRSTYGVTDLAVTLPDRTIVLPADKTKVSLDYEYAMKKALQYGREGNIIAVLFSWLDCKKTSYTVDISSAFVMDMDYIRSVAADSAAAVKQEMQDSSLLYDPDAKTLRVTVGVCGVALDEQAFISAVKDAYSKGNFTDISVDYDRTLYNPVDLTGFYMQNCTPVRDAAYVPETHEFVEEVIGFGFDLEAAQQQVNMAKEGETLVFRLETILPQVYLEQLKGAMFKDLLAESHTPHTKDDERTTNLILATAAINGTILNPGEVFSFNGVVGERTVAKGYRNGIVFTGGQSERGLGGGVCQVASTLYMATLLADLEVVERTEHMFTVDYLPLGMDATVYWGSLDYRFRNSTENPMLILANVEDGKVHVYFYGINNRDYTIDMTYEVLSTTQWKDEFIVDETKPVGYKEVKTTPYTGYRVVTYKTRVDQNGNKISTVRMDDSTYNVRNRQTIVGPDTEQTETPATPAAPTTPTTPATPAEPAKPAETTTPVTPAEPEKPAEPTTPTTPAEPEKPAETEKPVETPVEQEKPAAPVVTPTTPSTQPSDPMVAPATPGNLMPDIELNN